MPPPIGPLLMKNKQPPDPIREKKSLKISRRHFSQAGGAFTLAFLLGDRNINLTPAQAKTQKIPLQLLNPHQAALIDLLGDSIAPGAKAAGLSHYIDHQLSSTAPDNLLILKYLRVNPPFEGFYSSALMAFDKAINQRFAKNPAELTSDQMAEFITIMMTENPEGWSSAPPAPFFYFVLRSDAIDVTYGTMAAFDSLDIPYMAHIEPDHEWADRS